MDLLGVLLDLAATLADAAEAALAALEVGNRLKKVDSAEVWPETLGNEDLGVRNLPKEVVGKAHLARGADEQIRIGHVCRIEMSVNVLFGQVIGADVPELQFCGKAA